MENNNNEKNNLFENKNYSVESLKKKDFIY